MPILALDQNGRIYQTSPDRADGRGYGSTPECVEEGDLTLGSAYLKSQNRQRQEVINQRRAQEVMDYEDECERFTEQMGAKHRRRREEVESRMMENPKTREALIRRAAMSGCKCSGESSTLPTAMSGNGFSHNGETGWRGMSRDQQTIHHALTGMGSNTAYHVDPIEAEQARQKAEAERILRLGARR